MLNRKPMHILAVASLAVVLLAIFTTQLGSSPELTSGSISTGAPQRLEGTLPPGGVYRFTPAPIAGTSEPNPTLTLQIAILDADTGQAVKADILVNGVLARSGVDHAEFRLPGRTDGITITVRADRYAPWGQALSYKLNHSRVLYLQAKLTPLAIQSGALLTPTYFPLHPTVTTAIARAGIALIPRHPRCRPRHSSQVLPQTCQRARPRSQHRPQHRRRLQHRATRPPSGRGPATPLAATFPMAANMQAKPPARPPTITSHRPASAPPTLAPCPTMITLSCWISS